MGDSHGVSPIWPLLVPLYTVARAGQMLIASAVGSAALFIAIGWIAWSERLLMEAFAGALRDSVLLALVLALGTAMRHKAMWSAELRARLRAERAHHERQAHQQILEERLGMARELHDVTAHALAVVSIQLGLAKELVREDPERALDVLETTREANREAIDELQAAVRILRGESELRPDFTPTPGTSQLALLVDRAADSGLTAELVEEGDPVPVPPAVGLTLYRIAQESVTNVLKHSDASRLWMVLRYEADGVTLTLTDNGTTAATQNVQPGYGLTGMRERAAHLGGWLSAGPENGTGFVVRAWFPWSWEPSTRPVVATREGEATR